MRDATSITVLRATLVVENIAATIAFLSRFWLEHYRGAPLSPVTDVLLPTMGVSGFTCAILGIASLFMLSPLQTVDFQRATTYRIWVSISVVISALTLLAALMPIMIG
jgi:hypothetical protein